VKRRSILLVATAAITLGLLLTWRFMPRRGARSISDLAGTADKSNAVALGTLRLITSTFEEERTHKQEERAKTIFEAIERANVPINFWGKVVDQEERPIAGAEISYSYSTEHGNMLGVAWSASKVHKGSMTSDGTGLFSIAGIRGSGLTIESLQKEGYQYNPREAKVYDYFGSTAAGKFAPERNNPVVFVMVDKAATEQLVSYGGDFGKTVRLPANGTPLRLNIWNGQPDPNGELELTFKREPERMTQVGAPTTWSAKVEVINGGIAEARPDELIHRAPDEGYTGAVDYPKVEQKQGVGARSFYVKTADRKYGRITLELYPGDEGPSARCLIKAYMNPSGSRNLEFDPKKAIKPGS
jgi:hypothetical protein